MNRVVAKTPELSLTSMLETIRLNHVDIIPIIKDEIKDILPQYIEDIIRNVYESIADKAINSGILKNV